MPAFIISKWLPHFLGWIIITGLAYLIPKPPFIEHGVLNRTMCMLVIMFSFYINYFILVPRIQLKIGSWYYAASVLVLLGICFVFFSYFNHLFINPTNLDGLQFQRMRLTSPLVQASPLIKLAVMRSIPLTILTFIGVLISALIAFQENNRKKELEIASVKADLLDQELGLLRSQINPHFLFNALNNIYSMVIQQSENVGPMLLKLSEMLRYVIYDISEKEVAINKEIKYIANFIELHKVKYPDQDDISFSYTTSSLQISPMILIVFVENAFKHGKIDQYNHAFINISLEVINGSLTFEVKNSTPNNAEKLNANSGIGIENVKKRLQLIYPERFELNIKNSSSIFHVILKIALSK